MIVKLYSLKCDEPLCRVSADVVGTSLAAVERKLRQVARWRVERRKARGGMRTRHYCPRCGARRAEQAELDRLVRSL